MNRAKLSLLLAASLVAAPVLAATQTQDTQTSKRTMPSKKALVGLAAVGALGITGVLAYINRVKVLGGLGTSAVYLGNKVSNAGIRVNMYPVQFAGEYLQNTGFGWRSKARHIHHQQLKQEQLKRDADNKTLS